MNEFAPETPPSITARQDDASAATPALPQPAALAGYPPVLGEHRPFSEAQLADSLQSAIARWDGVADIWLFGYGSLIWNPGLPAEESCCARVHGYHRGLYMWSRVNRGTPERPGLVFALDRGGSCPGMAFRLAGAGALPHLETLWRREMSTGAYRPAWLPCTLADGRRVAALAFVIRRDAPSFTGRLPEEIVHLALATATGRYGTTLDYVTRTVDALRESGMPDRALEALLARCK